MKISSFHYGGICRKKKAKVTFGRIIICSVKISSFHFGGIWAAAASCSFAKEKDARWDQSWAQDPGRDLPGQIWISWSAERMNAKFRCGRMVISSMKILSLHFGGIEKKKHATLHCGRIICARWRYRHPSLQESRQTHHIQLMPWKRTIMRPGIKDQLNILRESFLAK